MNYKLVKGPDDTVWVSLQPLMTDVKTSLEVMESTDTKLMNDTEQQIVEFNIIGMKAIYTFLGALLQEHKTTEYEKSKTTD